VYTSKLAASIAYFSYAFVGAFVGNNSARVPSGVDCCLKACISREISFLLSAGRHKYHVILKKVRSIICTFQPVFIDPGRLSKPLLCICYREIAILEKRQMPDVDAPTNKRMEIDESTED